jgi:hypothetical protein
MANDRIEVKFDTTVRAGLIDVQDADELHYRFIGNHSTGVLSYLSKRYSEEPGLTGAALTIDGTKNMLDVSDFAYIDIQVTTAESGKSGDLYYYTRKTTL